ncbi:MAG TPA: acyl-CoA thioesterase [Candidatus Kryptonia bacterium]
MPLFRTEIEFEVSTYDIDAAHHVNNIVYVRWLEDLRCKLLASRYPVEELLKRNLYPVVALTKIRYRNQLRLADKLEGIIWVESIEHGLMRLKAIFQKADLVIVTAEQECVLMDLQTGKMDKKAMEIYL